MSEKNNRRGYIVTVSILLLIVGLLHILRVVMGWDMFVGGFFLSPWISLVVGIILLYLAYRGFKRKLR